MKTFYAVAGQSLADVCMNTYGSMDYFYKLLQDNNVTNANVTPTSNMPFIWDETLLIDSAINQTLTLNNIKYATMPEGNGNVYFVVSNDPQNIPQTPGGGNFPTPQHQSMYQKISSFYYTSTAESGETVLALTALQGKDIVQIEKNIQVLLPNEYIWNKTTGVLTLNDAIFAEEKLFILYSEMVTI